MQFFVNAAKSFLFSPIQKPTNSSIITDCIILSVIYNYYHYRKLEEKWIEVGKEYTYVYDNEKDKRGFSMFVGSIIICVGSSILGIIRKECHENNISLAMLPQLLFSTTDGGIAVKYVLPTIGIYKLIKYIRKELTK